MYLLEQVRVLDPVANTDQIADVLIGENGCIQAIEPHLVDHSGNIEVKPCQGLVLAPGLVDLYSYGGEPGFEERETVASLMASAGAGGFTRVALLPTLVPPVDHPATLVAMTQRWLTAAQDWQTRHRHPLALPPRLYFWGALTEGVQGQQMTEVGELATTEIVGFADGEPIHNLNLLRHLLEYLKPFQKPVALYLCDRKLAGSGVMREGNDSIRFGVRGIPQIAETVALAGVLELIADVDIPVHLMRVSTARSVELIREAKARGVPVTASTPWSHLLLNTGCIQGNWGSSVKQSNVALNSIPYNPSLRVDPPLGTVEDQQALLAGVKTGIIDAIAVDHCSYTYEEKTVAFANAPPGMIGLELVLPLLWQQLVTPGHWSALELWRALSSQPALCLQQSPPTLQVNQPAEAILFDPNCRWFVNQQTLKSLGNNTPWLDQQVAGAVISWVE